MVAFGEANNGVEGVPAGRRRSRRTRSVEFKAADVVAPPPKRARIQRVSPRLQRRRESIRLQAHDAFRGTWTPDQSSSQPHSPSQVSVTSVSRESKLEDLDAAESAWHEWIQCGDTSEVCGVGRPCAVIKCARRTNGARQSNVEDQEGSPEVALLRLHTSAQALSRTSSRNMAQFAGLCLLMAIARSPSSRRTARGHSNLLVVLSWEMRCFCIEISHAALKKLTQGYDEDALSNALLWIRGSCKQASDICLSDPRLSESILSSLSNSGFSIESPSSQAISLPCISLASKTSLRWIKHDSTLARSFHEFMHAEAVRLSRVRAASWPRRRRARSGRARWKPVAMTGLPGAKAIIIVPQFDIRTVDSLQEIALDESDSEEITADEVYIRRHRSGELAEKEAHAMIRDVTEMWAICDEPSCRKWRVLPEDVVVGENDRYYCGGRSKPDAKSCSVADDWLVRCLGEEGRARCAEIGITTVEGIVDDAEKLRKLERAGFYYDQTSQAIVEYEVS